MPHRKPSGNKPGIRKAALPKEGRLVPVYAISPEMDWLETNIDLTLRWIDKIKERLLPEGQGEFERRILQRLRTVRPRLTAEQVAATYETRKTG